MALKVTVGVIKIIKCEFFQKAEQLSKMYHGYDDDDEDYDEDEDNESEDYSGNESDFSDSSHWMKTMVQPSNTNVPKGFRRLNFQTNFPPRISRVSRVPFG